MLSRYKIKERIGVGGIGVVHRAEDLTLKREVALKFLSEESFAKGHMRARFQREARLAASLNHPNICVVHEVGEAAPGDEMVLGGEPQVEPGTPFLVMELIEGQTLDELIRERGSMPLPRLLEIAFQMTDALAEAHSKSIVHRDLKPKNVIVLPNGRPKILDFGMAKPLEPRDDDDVTRETQASSLEMTREGMVLGTVAYMSPEQASGKPVDSRSDIFSFGIMLYEMATGRKPFEGDSLTSTLAKIIETEPASLIEFRSDAPPEFVRIVHRCLRKNREDRYNDTRDLTVALKDLLHETSSGAIRRADVSASGRVAVAPKRRLRVASWAGAGLVVIAVAVGLALLVPKLLRGRREFVPPSFQQLTFTGSASYPTLAPDGRSLAYVASRPGGGAQVVIQDLGGGQQLPIFQAALVRSLRWSPTGADLLISGSSTGDVLQTYLVSRLGGATRPLPYLPFVAWSPAGDRFAGVTLSSKQIFFTETGSGAQSSIDLIGDFTYIYEVDWSTTGDLLAFRTSDEKEQHAIWTTTIDGGVQRVVVQGSAALHSPRFSPAGDAIYYLSGRAQARELHKIEIDARDGGPEGEPVTLLSGLQAGEQVAFSGNGKKLLYAREAAHTNLWLVHRQPDGGPATTSQLTLGTFKNEAPRFSPDGARMALIRTSSGNANIFVMSLADRQPQQLTFLSADVWQPVWSPDGSKIAFGTTMGDAPRVWQIDARGGTPEPFNDTALSRDLAWAPGSSILYQRPGNVGLNFLDSRSGDETAFMEDVGGGAADPMQFFSYMASPEYAPDGRSVAISCDCPDGAGVWVASVRGSSRTMIHDDVEALPVGWSADGAWVYVLEPEARRLLRIPSGGGSPEPWVELPFADVTDLDIAPDGMTIAAAVPVRQADIWLIENFDPELH
jgi:serine/threonine protein kinase/WD40 repeat protein